MRLNQALDIDALAGELARNRRLQVRDFFEPDSAEQIHAMLARETPWWLAYNVGDRVEQLAPETLARLQPQQFEQLFQGIVDRASRQYQFVYSFYPLLGTYFDPNAPKLPLHHLFEFLNSPPMLDWFRRLTGRDDVLWLDGQATLYQSGNFLKSHSDLDDKNSRAAAYVLNFTKGWERDWGGYLEFYNDNHDIELALRPIFNALNIFLVPTDHAVGVVAPFAPGDRLSVTGWLRTDPPPGRFGQPSAGG